MFNKDKSRKGGLSPVCKVCRAVETKRYSRSDYNKKYFKTDSGRYIRFIYALDYNYGLSEESFCRLRDETKGVCPVCLREFTYDNSGTKMVVDHCHDTGEVRGVLCSNCNIGLGKIGDTLESSERLVKYLRRLNVGI